MQARKAGRALMRVVANVRCIVRAAACVHARSAPWCVFCAAPARLLADRKVPDLALRPSPSPFDPCLCLCLRMRMRVYLGVGRIVRSACVPAVCHAYGSFLSTSHGHRRVLSLSLSLSRARAVSCSLFPPLPSLFSLSPLPPPLFPFLSLSQR